MIYNNPYNNYPYQHYRQSYNNYRGYYHNKRGGGGRKLVGGQKGITHDLKKRTRKMANEIRKDERDFTKWYQGISERSKKANETFALMKKNVGERLAEYKPNLKESDYEKAKTTFKKFFDYFKDELEQKRHFEKILRELATKYIKMKGDLEDISYVQETMSFNDISKSFFGEIFQKTMHTPFLQHFRLTQKEKYFHSKLTVSSFSITLETKENTLFKDVQSVRITDKLKRLYQVLMQRGGNQLNDSSYSREENLFKLIGYDSKIIKYDALIYDEAKPSLVAIGKLSVATIVNIEKSVWGDNLQYKKLNMLKKLCQLERQCAYVKNLSDLSLVALFGIGEVGFVDLDPFFKNNDGLFPCLQELNSRKCLYVGRFDHFSSKVKSIGKKKDEKKK